MKPGAEYEEFVYEKLRHFYVNARVTKNDSIHGYESGLEREIDVSIRFKVRGADFLYIVQCKDWKKSRADIKVLGEFSAVMQDVRAAKGFLLCTAGFAKSNHKYALAKGIELFTIEDIQSEHWKAEIQIPFIYVRKVRNVALAMEIVPSQALIAKNRDPLKIHVTTGTPLTVDGGESTFPFEKHVHEGFSKLLSAEQPESKRMDLTLPGLQIMVADVWTPCKISIQLVDIERINYLKYLTPKEYSHIRDHVREKTVPLNLQLANIGLRLDDTFVKLPKGPLPIFPGFSVEVEESNLASSSAGMKVQWGPSSMSIGKRSRT